VLPFKRSLDVPEYHDSYVKIVPGSTAFFCGASVTGLERVERCPSDGHLIPVLEATLFGISHAGPLRFPRIRKLLTTHEAVVFEIDDIVQHVNMPGKALYQKGIAVAAREPTLIELSELLVEHPGMDLKRAGLNKGWFYRIRDNGDWIREPTSYPKRPRIPSRGDRSVLAEAVLCKTMDFIFAVQREWIKSPPYRPSVCP
jgi:hypothetical protein